MKFIYCMGLLFVNCLVLNGMEKKLKKTSGLVRLINVRPGIVQKNVEKNEEGHRVKNFFLIDRTDGYITEFYFSREVNELGEVIWYGKMSYTIGRYVEGRDFNAALFNSVLQGKDAREGFRAIRKRYKKQKNNLKEKY